MAFHERPTRSLVKALTFRVVVITSDLIIVYAITHRYDTTLGVVLFSNLSSSILYYTHERAWNGVHWGRQPTKKNPRKGSRK